MTLMMISFFFRLLTSHTRLPTYTDLKGRQHHSNMPLPLSSRGHRSGGGAGQLGAMSRNLLAALLVSVVLVAPTVHLLSSSSSSAASLPPSSASSPPQYDSLSLAEPLFPAGARRRDKEKAALRGRREASGSTTTTNDISSPVETVDTATTTAATSSTSSLERTLVMYVYHESNDWYKDNLRFFIKVAMQDNDNDDVDYLLIINGESDLPLEALLAKTSAQQAGRVRLLRRPNTCYDGGSIGEVLRAQPHLAESYRYYIFINSSVRGPFLPRYFQTMAKAEAAEGGGATLAWTSIFTSLLNDEVKLAGTTVSCMGQVHVQSMVLATDQLGLGLLLKGGVLDCPTSLNSAIRTYEFGATTTILDAGYNIDSLLTRYRGVDWRQQRALSCNAGMNPQGEQMNDGLGLDPFEVVFIKAKEYPRVAATQAFLSRYTDYAMGRDDLTSNDFDSPRVQVALAQERALLKARVLRCKATFDADFYFKHNPDLAGAVQEAQALDHFNDYGFVERRPYRYKSSSWRKARDKDCRWE